MSLRKVQGIVKAREPWRAAGRGVAKVDQDLASEQLAFNL